MPDGIGALISRWDRDEWPATAEIFGVPTVLRPAAGNDFDLFGRLSGAGDVMERTVGQSIEWRRMCLKGDGFVRVRSAEDASGDNNVEWL